MSRNVSINELRYYQTQITIPKNLRLQQTLMEKGVPQSHAADHKRGPKIAIQPPLVCESNLDTFGVLPCVSTIQLRE